MMPKASRMMTGMVNPLCKFVVGAWWWLWWWQGDGVLATDFDDNCDSYEDDEPVVRDGNDEEPCKWCRKKGS